MTPVTLKTSLIALTIACLPVSALAQETADAAAAPDEGGIQAIVVTAQKRAENVQDVPIAISTFTASSLQERAVGDVSQLSGIAPNVNLDAGTPFSGSSAVLSAFIRGIGSDDFAFNIDPGVGVYVDGVYLARTVGANQDLLDVERIEVLKGPQGTLFGRNTIGGAISIVTRDPGDEFRFMGDVTTGSYDLIQVRGSADLPISDSLSSSVSFGVKNRKGYLKRLAYPGAATFDTDPYTSFSSAGFDTASREGKTDNWNLRGKLKWDNGGPLTLTLSGDYTKDESTTANKLLATTEFVPGPFANTLDRTIPGSALNPSPDATTYNGFLFAGLYNFCIGSTAAEISALNADALCGVRGTQFNPDLQLSSLASVNVDGDPGNDRLPWDNRYLHSDIDKSYASANSFSDLKSWGLGGTLQYDVSDALTLKSITAYRELHWKAGLDADGSPLNFLQLSFTMNQWQFSQELQVLGHALDNKLNYVLGAYYFKEAGDLHDYVTFAEGLLQVDGPNDLKTQNYAFFGQIDYRPIDLIGITIGGRYTDEKKWFEGGQQDLNGFNYKLFGAAGCADASGNINPVCQAALSFPDPNNPVRVYVPGVNKNKFSNFSPKLGVQLHPTDDVMLYASWSKGYKTGGWTTRLTNPQGNVAPDFDEEKATTWEAGIKSMLIDRRLQLNAAVFTTDYKGIQLNIQIGTSPTIDTAGDARLKGFEVEMVAAPFDGLNINGSIGHIDAEYSLVDAAVAAVSGPHPFQAGTLEGGPLPKTPSWKTNISPRYEAKLGNGGALIFLADWTHTTSVWNDTQRTFLLKRPSSDIVNASATYEEPNGRWTLTVGGTNLTKDRYLTSGGSNIAAGVMFGTYNRPREWYARLGVKF